MHYRSLLALSFTMPFIVFAAASSSDHAITHNNKKAISTFTPDHYGNSHFSVIFWGPHRLEQFKSLALSAKEAPDISDDMKKLLSYVRTLDFVEQTLLHKPYKFWLLKDLKAINAKLSEFHPKVKHPGEFRMFTPAPRMIKLFSKEEITRLQTLQNDPSKITETDQKFMSKSLHIFPPADDVTTHVALMLINMKQNITAREESSETTTDSEIDLVGFLHQSIREIRPWPKRNKATARILGHIICMQHGIEPPTFEDKQTYVQIMAYCAQQKQYAPLSDYIGGLVEERQQWKALAEKEVY